MFFEKEKTLSYQNTCEMGGIKPPASLKTKENIPVSAKKTIEEIQSFIDELTDVFIENDGNIAIEFSTMEENVTRIMRYVSKVNRRFGETLNSKSAQWEIFFCETCNARHADYPFHVQITKN